MPKVKVYQLQAGDILSPTNRVVEYCIPQGLSRTPPGKAVVKLRGQTAANWGRHTTVTINEPKRMTPTQIYRNMINSGSIDPECDTCKRYFGTEQNPQPLNHAPAHKAQDFCQSGGRPHCTCKSCF